MFVENTFFFASIISHETHESVFWWIETHESHLKKYARGKHSLNWKQEIINGREWIVIVYNYYEFKCSAEKKSWYIKQDWQKMKFFQHISNWCELKW